MLKYVLIASAMTMTVPALAQTAANPTPGAPAAAPVAPTTAPDPMATAPQAAPADATQPAPAADPAATQTAAQPAATGAEVAQAVDSQFTTYDKDGDGKLSPAEFGTWMVALKSQSDPKTDPNSPATKKWNQAAFAQADTDKSKSLSKTEMTGFLSPAKS